MLEKPAGERAYVYRHPRRVGESESMNPRRVAGDHHATRHRDGNAGTQKRVQARPLHVRKAQALIGNATLLEKELPGRYGGAHDGDHQEHEGRRQPARRHPRD